MEKEIIETYYYKPSDFNQDGRRYLDGKTFRDYIKECEIDFHNRHSTEYAYNLYANLVHLFEFLGRNQAHLFRPHLVIINL